MQSAAAHRFAEDPVTLDEGFLRLALNDEMSPVAPPSTCGRKCLETPPPSCSLMFWKPFRLQGEQT